MTLLNPQRSPSFLDRCSSQIGFAWDRGEGASLTVLEERPMPRSRVSTRRHRLPWHERGGFSKTRSMDLRPKCAQSRASVAARYAAGSSMGRASNQAWLSAPVPAHAVVPNSISTRLVSAMASAPQNRTRIAPTLTPAPPVRAATHPRSAKNTSEVPENKGIRPSSGAMAVTRTGKATPSAKRAADVNAA